MKTETRIWLVIFVLAGGYLAWRSGPVRHRQSIRRAKSTAATTPAGVADTVAGTAQFSLSRTIGIWVAALLTLCVFSFLYRDNPFYKLAESIFVGVSAAYWMVVAFWDVLVPNLFAKIWPAAIQAWAMPGLSPERDQWWWVNLIPLSPGCDALVAARAARRLAGRLAAGLYHRARSPVCGWSPIVQADFLSQIRSSILSVIAVDPSKSIRTAAVDRELACSWSARSSASSTSSSPSSTKGPSGEFPRSASGC